MGAQGTTTIDFGAFPGKSDASAAVAQAAIGAGNLVEAWIWPVATADHTIEEHMVESLKVFAANIVAGVGFTIYGFNTSEINEPVERIPEQTYIQTGSATAIAIKTAFPGLREHLTGGGNRGGKGTRLYGLFTVAWVWN